MGFDPNGAVLDEPPAPSNFNPAGAVLVEHPAPAPKTAAGAFDPAGAELIQHPDGRPVLPYPDVTPDRGPEFAQGFAGDMLVQRDLKVTSRDAAISDANAALSPGVKIHVNDGTGYGVSGPATAEDMVVANQLGARLEKLHATQTPEEKRAAELKTMGQDGTMLWQWGGALLDQAAGALGLGKRMVGQGKEAGDVESGLSKTAAEMKAVAANDESAAGSMARAGGTVAGLAVGGPAGKLGMLTGALRAGSETYSSTLERTGDEHLARKEAALTVPALLLYLGAGRVAGNFAGRLIARDASALTEGLAQFAGAEVANIGTSSVLRALGAPEGKGWEAAKPTVESLTADTLFAALHGVGAYGNVGQVVKLRAQTELRRRGFEPAQLKAPPIEGEFTKVSGDDGAPADALVPRPAPEPPSPTQQQFESQLATQEGVTKGAPTVVLGTKGTEYPAVYAWAPSNLIQPSHTGELMAVNPAYPLTNTRDYSDPAERDKALETRNTWDPRRAITDSPDAAVGPPMVARVIDEDGQATLAVVGGNNRQWAMQNLSPEQQAAHFALSNAKAASFGLSPTEDPQQQIVRHLGTVDFRKPGERARLQGMVDGLNPSPGMVQGTAKRAEIDAASVPVEQLGDLSMEIAPADAQAAVRGLIERGLTDRNRTAAIAASGSQSQDYVQRLLVNAGFRIPQIAEVRNDARAGNATMRGLIDAATPVLVRLRQRGANDVADSIARSFATLVDTAKGGDMNLPQALATVAAQQELDPVHAPAQAIAAGLAQRLVLDKAGKLQAEPTIAAARDYFAGIEKAVSQHQEGADLFGGSRTMAETVQAGASMVREGDEPLDAAGLPPAPLTLPDEAIYDSRTRPTMPDGTPRAVWREQQISAELAKGVPVPPGTKPVAYFLAGGPGAGKSTLLRRMQADGAMPAAGYIEVNPDNFTERNPDFLEIARQGDSRAARVVEMESSEMARQLFARALKTHAPLVYDATLASERVAEAVATAAREAGYETRMVGLSNDLITSLQQARSRAETNMRYVTTDYGLETHRRFNANVERYAPLFDHWELWFEPSAAPEPLLQKEGTRIRVAPGRENQYIKFSERGTSQETSGGVLKTGRSTPDGGLHNQQGGLGGDGSQGEGTGPRLQSQDGLSSAGNDRGATPGARAEDGRASEGRLAEYLDAKGITNQARRDAATAEFTGWLQLGNDPGLRAPYRQLDLGLESGEVSAGRGGVADRSAAERGRADVHTDAERAGARAVQSLARGLAISPAELQSAFAGGHTISTIVPRLVSLEIPRIDWKGVRIETIADWAILHRALRTPFVESFKVAIVHPGTREIVHSAVLSTGTLDSTAASARDIVQVLTRLPYLGPGKRYEVYEAHNHPSGVPTPSRADRQIYAQHAAALEAAGAELVDEAVTNGDTFYSIALDKELPFPGGPELAPWELTGRRALKQLTDGGELPFVAQALRTSDPLHLHVIYGNTQLAISAIQRLPADLSGEALTQAIIRGGIQQGAKYAWISAPYEGDSTVARDYLTAVAERLNKLAHQGNAPFVADISTRGVLSFAAANYIQERSAKYRVPGLAELAVRASALESLREEGPQYSPLKALNSAGGAHADVPLTGLQDIRIIQMPEMVQLARDLMGQLPELRRMGPMGTFRPLGDGRVALDPRIFANPVEAAKVLAHELGHLASWFPQRDMQRGNLHGHLHSLHRFLRDRFGAANMSNREMRQELIAVTRYWRPYDLATSSAGFVRYRESASELYADAVSVLFNSPATLKQMAPKFYHEFFRGLDTKPEVKAAFLDLQAWLQRPMMAQLKLRSDKVSVMFGQAEAIFERRWQEREERYRGFGGWLSRLKQGFFDNFSPLLDREASAGQSQAADSARFFFDEHPLVAGNRSHRWLERMHRTVAAPAEAAGFSLDQVGQLLFFNRIANERYEVGEAMQERLASPTGGRTSIANPQGHTPETARLGLLQMRLENGIRGQTLLEAAVQRFHDLVYDVMVDAHDAGLFTAEQMQLIRDNRDNYATFTPLEYVDLYLPAGFFAQAGTLKEIQNPFVSTVSKVLTMIRAIQHNRAKATTVQILQRDFPAEIEPAVTVRDAQGREQPRPPRDKSLQQIMLRAGGRPAWFNVPKEIALMFERPDVPLLESALELLNAPFRKFFYPLMITFNPVFQLVRNPVRDARRSYVNAPAGIGFWGIARQLPLVKQIGPNPALDAVRDFIKAGRTQPIIAEMLDNLAITPGEATFTATAGQPVTSFDRMLQQFGVLPEEQNRWRATRLPVIGRVLGAIETAGRMNELLPKVSAYQLLRNRAGWAPRDAAFYVRNYIGTPNFLKRGKHIGLANPILPFINIWMRGWAADADLMRHGFQRTAHPDQPGKSPASWWFRWAATSGIWTVMKAAASLGLLGLALKKLMDGISEHYKTNYDVIPIGRVGTSDYDPEGKVAFIPIPKDPTDRVVSAILYNTLKAAGAKAAQSGMFGDELKEANANADVRLANMFAQNLSVGASDVPGLNPLLKIGSAWQAYLTGQNPIDSYRNQPILSDAEHLAGGWDAVKPMLAWTYNQTGANSFASFDPDAGFTLEQTANLPIIRGMVKVTDYGYREQQQAGERLEQAAAARIRLGMPANAQRLAGEYGYLSRLGADDRTEAQAARYNELKAWHRQYRTAEEQLTSAKENELSADDQKAIRQSVEEMSKDYERKP